MKEVQRARPKSSETAGIREGLSLQENSTEGLRVCGVGTWTSLVPWLPSPGLTDFSLRNEWQALLWGSVNVSLQLCLLSEEVKFPEKEPEEECVQGTSGGRSLRRDVNAGHIWRVNSPGNRQVNRAEKGVRASSFKEHPSQDGPEGPPPCEVCCRSLGHGCQVARCSCSSAVGHQTSAGGFG